MNKIFWIILLSLLTQSLQAAYDFQKAVSELQHLSDKAFCSAFDFDQYLDAHDIVNIKALEVDRNFLETQGVDGNFFMQQLFSHYLDRQKIDFEDPETVKPLLDLGELLSHSEFYLPDSIAVYWRASDMIFQTLSDSLENGIREKQIDANDFNVKYFIQRLIDNKYAITFKPKNWQKLWGYVKEGRWSYIYHKFTSTYQKEFMIAVSIFLLMAAGIGRLIFVRRRRKAISLNHD